MPAAETDSTVPPRSPYEHGFFRIAAAVPHVRVGDPEFNAERTLALAQRAADAGAALVIFPELGLAAYSSEDLFHQARCSTRSTQALERGGGASAELRPGPLVGAPVRAEGGLFNAALVIHRGRILGAVPKSYLPEYREYYEKRQFRAARDLIGDEVQLLGADRSVRRRPDLRLPRPPRLRRSTSRSARTCGRRSRRARTARWPARPCSPTCRPATSPSARPTTAAQLCEAQSARTISAYVYTAAGLGESTTDLAWDGQALIYENGQMLAESERFSDERAADRRRHRSRPAAV